MTHTHFPETFMKLSTMIVIGRARTKTPLMIAPLAISFPAAKQEKLSSASPPSGSLTNCHWHIISVSDSCHCDNGPPESCRNWSERSVFLVFFHKIEKSWKENNSSRQNHPHHSELTSWAFEGKGKSSHSGWVSENEKWNYISQNESENFITFRVLRFEQHEVHGELEQQEVLPWCHLG